MILQDELASQVLPAVLTVPLTSQLSGSRFPSTVLVDAAAGTGLRTHSLAPVVQTTAIDRNQLRDLLGCFGANVLDSITSHSIR